jgi:hypothetical protein
MNNLYILKCLVSQLHAHEHLHTMFTNELLVRRMNVDRLNVSLQTHQMFNLPIFILAGKDNTNIFNLFHKKSK